jgi:hypothetical protein
LNDTLLLPADSQKLAVPTPAGVGRPLVGGQDANAGLGGAYRQDLHEPGLDQREHGPRGVEAREHHGGLGRDLVLRAPRALPQAELGAEDGGDDGAVRREPEHRGDAGEPLGAPTVPQIPQIQGQNALFAATRQHGRAGRRDQRAAAHHGQHGRQAHLAVLTESKETHLPRDRAARKRGVEGERDDLGDRLGVRAQEMSDRSQQPSATQLVEARVHRSVIVYPCFLRGCEIGEHEIGAAALPEGPAISPRHGHAAQLREREKTRRGLLAEGAQQLEGQGAVARAALHGLDDPRAADIRIVGVSRPRDDRGHVGGGLGLHAALFGVSLSLFVRAPREGEEPDGGGEGEHEGRAEAKT